MVGLKKGSGGGVIPTMVVVGLGFLLVLIHTTTAETPKPDAGATKKVSEVYPDAIAFCESIKDHQGTEKERAEKFLMDHKVELEDARSKSAFEAGIKACCIEDQATKACEYDTTLGAIVLKHKMNGTPKPDGTTTTKGGASGIGGFSEKVILITVLAGKLFL